MTGVFHLAAQSHPPTSLTNPLETFETNVTGSANLIQCITDFQPDCKLMFCSTSEVYGNVGQDGRKIKITDSIMPANPYGASKAAIDLYMQERMTNGKLKGFITRAFSHTGPRRGKNFSISSDAF
jgi:GDP-D-mannose dehydratase